MRNLEQLNGVRNKIALWGTAAALALAASGCNSDDAERQATAPVTSEALQPKNANQPLKCSDKTYQAKQGESILIELDDDYEINVVNAGVVTGAHLMSALLIDQQTDQSLSMLLGENLEDIDFVRHLPATGESETVYRVQAEAVPGNPQEANISLCSTSPSDMDATWEHVQDDTFNKIQPPTAPSNNQPPVNNNQI